MTKARLNKRPASPQFLTPDIRLERMSSGEYAVCRVAVGDHIERVGPHHWVVAKRFFYRPLLRYEPLDIPESLQPQVGVGGFHYIVANERDANSRVGVLILDRLGDYSLETVSHNRRRLVTAAAKTFSIRPIRQLDELIDRGYAAYLSFYERTGYEYASQRRRHDEFSKWAKATFDASKALLLGGFGPDGLVAVSVSYWVGSTLLYATFFSDTAALKKGVGELMLHSLREAASRAVGVQRILVRPYQGGNGMDQYYQMRGAKLIYLPARLYLHPLTRFLLKTLVPSKYRLLKGTDSRSGGQQAESAANQPLALQAPTPEAVDARARGEL